MFAGSHHFIVGGGTFNNTMNHYHMAPVEPPNFRTISIGDIDLQRELIVNKGSGAIDRRLGRERIGHVRRMYSAKIEGRNSDVTVAMYEGAGAEEDWRRDVERYIFLRHPNLLQIYGVASSGAMHATIFYGDLIPYTQFALSFSPIMNVYNRAYYAKEWKHACDYVERSPYISESVRRNFWNHCTLSVRRSNGLLCADFDPHLEVANGCFGSVMPRKPRLPVDRSLEALSQEAAAIDALTLEEYHFVCRVSLQRSRSGFISSSATISSTVYLWPSEGLPQESGGIVLLAEDGCTDSGGRLDEEKLHSTDSGWGINEEEQHGELMKNEWTRFNAKVVYNNELVNTLWFDVISAWFAQANHIFSRLQATTNLNDYVLVRRIDFTVSIGNATQTSGYLFLCPPKDFRAHPIALGWPDCPGYWSLDPSGANRLSTEEATRRGFPAIQLTTKVFGHYWDTSVYAGLRQFHRAKGFDPDSQDVALHLGLPLFQLSEDASPFAYMDELSEDEDDIDEYGVRVVEDTEDNAHADREHSFIGGSDSKKYSAAHGGG
ncbi:hypothetical protein C8F04DRAFT_1138261, partial [Mycena alexandri]